MGQCTAACFSSCLSVFSQSPMSTDAALEDLNQSNVTCSTAVLISSDPLSQEEKKDFVVQAR